ncbi:MAG: ribosome silencing factor [Bacteroidota bacterium]
MAQPSLQPQRTPDKQRTTPTPVHTLARLAVDAALDKKAKDVTVLDMRKVSGVADIFVLCNGDTDIQVRAIAQSVRMKIKEACDELPWHSEGLDSLQWVLLDYVDLVVHVFQPEKRDFYSLERLWGDAEREDVPDDASGSEVVLLRDEGT